MPKPNLAIIVEGHTEKAALPALLGEHLYNNGLATKFTIIGDRKSRGQGGGHKSFETLVWEISAIAKDSPGIHISTYFDYYGLNSRWPEVTAIKAEAIDAASKVAKIEAAILAAVAAKVGPDILWNGHFHPYIQLHEFETLLFAAPEILGQELHSRNPGDDLKNHFTKIVDQHQNQCEHINDHVDTAPSKRIEAVAQYKKGKTGQARTILPAVGLDRIRQACPHFDEWIKTLEGLKSCT